MTVRTAAVAPNHITGLFVPDLRARDPRGRGSIGAGVVLDTQVKAEVVWVAGERRRILLGSTPRVPLPISREVARRLLGARRGRLEVRLTHDLPVGQGFGSSAAGALATGLAVAAALELPARAAIETAHLADLFGGGGLGGVAAILGGGLEIRHRAGVPPWGRISHRRWNRPIFIAVVGPPLPSPRLLRQPSFLRRVRRAAAEGLRALESAPGPETFLDESTQFSDRLQLGPARIRAIVHSLRSPKVAAGQTMFGQAVYAVATGPSAEKELVDRFRAAGLEPIRCGASRSGAQVVDTGVAEGRLRRAANARLLNGGRSRPAP